MNSSKKQVHFTPVETKKASQRVFEHLRSLILQGILRSGDELPSERQMMQQFRRSHPTIREALRMLEAAGLIEVLPGNAAVVRPADDNPVQKPLDELFRYKEVTTAEVVEFMASIEPDFAVLTAKRRTPADLVHLAEKLDALASVEKIAIQQILPFHNAAARSTKNPLIAAVWEALTRILVAVGAQSESGKDDSTLTVLDIHRRLLQAFQEQNGPEAAAAVALCWENWHEIPGKLTMDGVETGSMLHPDDEEKPFTPLRTEKVSEAVYRQIQEKIMTGELLPGDRLPPERKLMEMFQRSRPTIREALRMLESRHLIRTIPGSGTVINALSTQSAERSLLDLIERQRAQHEDLKELRNICETVIASWAAQRRREDDLAELDDLVRHSSEFVDQIEESMANGHRFNLILARSSHNKAAYVISQAVSEVNYYLVKKNWHSAGPDMTNREMKEHSRKIWEQHARIYEAVRDQDSFAARKATLEHIDESNKAVD